MSFDVPGTAFLSASQSLAVQGDADAGVVHLDDARGFGRGWGARSFNLGAEGAAFGVANHTTLNFYQLLKAGYQRAFHGMLFTGDALLRQEANDLFDALSQAGAIEAAPGRSGLRRLG